MLVPLVNIVSFAVALFDGCADVHYICSMFRFR